MLLQLLFPSETGPTFTCVGSRDVVMPAIADRAGASGLDVMESSQQLALSRRYSTMTFHHPYYPVLWVSCENVGQTSDFRVRVTSHFTVAPITKVFESIWYGGVLFIAVAGLLSKMRQSPIEAVAIFLGGLLMCLSARCLSGLFWWSSRSSREQIRSILASSMRDLAVDDA